MANKFNSLNEVLRSLDFAILRNDKDEPADLKALRTGRIPIGAGGQYGSTWEFVWGLLRDLPMGAWHPLVQFCDTGLGKSRRCLANEQIVDLMVALNKPYFPFLRYAGFTEMADLFDGAIKFAPTATRAELGLITRGFLRYLNRYTSYCLFYFDWKVLGDKYPYDTTLAAVAPNVDFSRRVRITSGQKIRMSWDKLGVVVYGYLATNENPVLCSDFIQCLPFEALHMHVMVSGKSTYAWAPIVTTAPAPVTERQCDAPVGRLRFSQATGMKLIVQYGTVTEDVETPVLGEIFPQYQRILTRVGDALWSSTYNTKEEIKVRVELADD